MTDNNNSGFSLAGRKILIIEDDTFLGGIFLHHLTDQKVNARLLTTGENAIAEIKKDIPEFIILDIMLPGMSGLDILESIRKDPELASIPVIVVSNTDQSADLKRVKAAGSEFLMKALATPSNITDKIKKILSGHGK